MATNTLTGQNISFPIYGANGSTFHGLVLRKAVVDSVVMSLGDKITGDVCYKDNNLQFTMQEYVKYNGVNYYLVNPPTVVREGLVGDNSDLGGMTKYSFEFYHPMYMLANFPFTDVATKTGEEKYLSQSKVFSWIGKPQDFFDKLNKNLQGTQWYVRKSSRFPQEKDDELSEVLSFDNQTVADAIKTAYETWDIPYIVSQIPTTDTMYAQGKRFLVEFGLPSNEIYESDSARQLGNPFVFRFGQGVGLKNNSRTPKKNKIVTRIAGYGSEDNVPYGYPQIEWTGIQAWDYTVNNNPNAANSYPIYNGIVGGRNVRLIKHPFTRTHLMPSIYSETVNKKVNPYATGYNPSIEIKDYYDADGTYPNPINIETPCYESHEFTDIKPELDSDRNLGIISATPLNTDLTPADSWDDTMDDDGNYIQSYFKIKLPQLSFDLYACAAITQEMQINMRSGACIGCTFPVQVDWDDYKKNFYDKDGNFLPDGEQRDYEKYPKSNSQQIEVIVQKENSTFGTLMPNIYQQPRSGDNFVFLGISLPLSYITDAEQRLDEAMRSYMLENNVYYFDYPLKFDEYFIAKHVSILNQIQPNSIIHFEYGGEELQLFVKQLTIKYNNTPLPQYDITLTDNIEVVLNQIGQVADDVEKLSSLISILRQTYSRNVWAELAKKLSKTQDDTAQGLITFMKGLSASERSEFLKGILLGSDGIYNIDENGDARLRDIIAKAVQSENYMSGLRGWGIDANGNAEVGTLHVRDTLEVDELRINRQQAQEGDTIFSDNDQILAVEKVVDDTDGSTSYILTLKEKWEGYFTAQMYGNILRGKINTLAAKEAGVSDYSDDTTGQERDSGQNLYYTSYMTVTATHNTTPSMLGVNQIRVVLWGDDDVPMSRNFPPCPMMVIVRWGCVDYSDEYADDPSYEAVKADIRRRQQLFVLSSNDGRITKLVGVSKPILEDGNIGATFGTLPEFVKNNNPEVARRVIDGRDYLYAQGVVVGDFIQTDIQGVPVPTVVNVGDWVDGSETGTPTVGYGIYLANEFNERNQRYETHAVRHRNGTWKCMMHQPVTTDGVTTYHEPKWNSPYWSLLDGNGHLSMEFTSSKKGPFRFGSVDTVITPYIYYGNVDITADIGTEYYSWTRQTQGGEKTDDDRLWDSNHVGVRALSLADSDLPDGWGRGVSIEFTCTCTVNDGKKDIIVDNQVIV